MPARALRGMRVRARRGGRVCGEKFISDVEQKECQMDFFYLLVDKLDADIVLNICNYKLKKFSKGHFRRRFDSKFERANAL